MLVESPPSPESRERSVNPPLRTFKALFAAPYEKSLKTPSPLLPRTSQVKSNSKPKKQETKRKHRKSPTGHTRCRVAHQVRDRQGASFLEAFLDPGLWGFGAFQGFRVRVANGLGELWGSGLLELWIGDVGFRVLGFRGGGPSFRALGV